METQPKHIARSRARELCRDIEGRLSYLKLLGEAAFVKDLQRDNVLKYVQLRSTIDGCIKEQTRELASIVGRDWQAGKAMAGTKGLDETECVAPPNTNQYIKLWRPTAMSHETYEKLKTFRSKLQQEQKRVGDIWTRARMGL